MYRRISVFCIYCKNGDALEADMYLLNELNNVSDYVVVVVNGTINNLSILIDNSNKVIIRENTGFDAAAYKYAFEDIDFNNAYNSCDELILCNNSFFGPFEPLSVIIEKMEKEDCDFWGITSSEKNLVKHIQSYFFLFRKNIIKDDVLKAFFDTNITYALSYNDVCRVFENGLFLYLVELGYEYSAYVKNISCENYRNCFGSVCLDKVPILKRKSFSKEFSANNKWKSAIKYIYENYDFEINIILDSIYKLYGITFDKGEIDKLVYETCSKDLIEKPFRVTRKEIFEYIDNNDAIYIYGTGGTALHIYNCFFINGRENKLLGFLVSDDKDNQIGNMNGYPVWKYSNKITEKKHIILAVRSENVEELLNNISIDDEIFELW